MKNILTTRGISNPIFLLRWGPGLVSRTVGMFCVGGTLSNATQFAHVCDVCGHEFTSDRDIAYCPECVTWPVMVYDTGRKYVVEKEKIYDIATS